MTDSIYDRLIAIDTHLEQALAHLRMELRDHMVPDVHTLRTEVGAVERAQGDLAKVIRDLTRTCNPKDLPAEICEDGWVKPRITYTMDGDSYILALFRYGDRYFLRDAGARLSRTRCSFNIRCEDLKACIEQADREPSPLGDILSIEIYQDDTSVSAPCGTAEEERPATKGMTLLDYIGEEDTA